VARLKTINKIVSMALVPGSVVGGILVSVPVKISGIMKNPHVTFLCPSAAGSEVIGMVTRTPKLPVALGEPILPATQQRE